MYVWTQSAIWQNNLDRSLKSLARVTIYSVHVKVNNSHSVQVSSKLSYWHCTATPTSHIPEKKLELIKHIPHAPVLSKSFEHAHNLHTCHVPNVSGCD